MPEPATARELLERARRPHLVGVAGAAMRSMASLLLELGREVSGSDSGSISELADMAERGARLRCGHDGRNVAGADLVIVSAAVPDDNPELVAARAGAIPILSHAQALGALMATRDGIGVAGTHGKSTTTALVAHILTVAGRDPTLAGGAHAIDFGGFSHLGHGRELVAEADEYGRRFLELHPRLAIITAVEPDHLDYYGTFDAIKEAFQRFVDGMATDGLIVTCEDEPNLARLRLTRRRVRYGWAGHADWRLEQFWPRAGGGASIEVRRPDGERAQFEMKLNGRHNAANAVAALAVCHGLGVNSADARNGLATFSGTGRRFETVAQAGGVWVVDDYAHHPTEIAVNLQAARDVHAGRLVAVFQPHTIHRTLALLDDFVTAFSAADRLVLAPLYQPTGRGDGAEADAALAELAGRIDRPAVTTATSLDDAYALAAAELQPGTMVMVLGAGDVTTVARRLAQTVAAGSVGAAVAAGGRR